MPTKSILGKDLPIGVDAEDTKEKAKLFLQQESDVIISSVILGFIITRYYQGQVCQFDFEHPTQKQIDSWLKEDISKSEPSPKYKEYLKEVYDFNNILSVLSYVVETQDADMGKSIKGAQSPFGKEGKLITGKKGGAMNECRNRSTPLTYSKAKMLKNAMTVKKEVYQGRGAYTGIVDNPIKENNNLYPTMRVDVPPEVRKWQGFPSAENPYLDPAKIAPVKLLWGLISGLSGRRAANPEYTLINLGSLPNGMGPIPPNVPVGVTEQKVGYVHGMCVAIVSCQKDGPWCTPYEMATGDVTTKMASCFPCSTYMHSAGYAPSSVHLGRGESWVPPKDYKMLEYKNHSNGAHLNNPCNATISDNLLLNWNREIYKQITVGLSCMNKALKYITPDYQVTMQALDEKLKQVYLNGTGENDMTINAFGGSFFLDALTIHDKEISRLQRTFEPAYDIIDFMQKETLDQFGA